VKTKVCAGICAYYINSGRGFGSCGRGKITFPLREKKVCRWARVSTTSAPSHITVATIFRYSGPHQVESWHSLRKSGVYIDCSMLQNEINPDCAPHSTDINSSCMDDLEKVFLSFTSECDCNCDELPLAAWTRRPPTFCTYNQPPHLP
jgi:hypothetical protein